MDAAFSALRRFPFEMLDDVGDVDLGSVYTYFFEDLVQQTAGGADEGMAGAILGVSRLFADEHDAGRGRSFSEDRLSRVFPEITCFAGFGRGLKIGKSQGVWDRGGSLLCCGFALSRNIRSLRGRKLWLQMDEGGLTRLNRIA